ncbi:hypothetical protein Vretifemale_3976 [Volvox reticuliferus]|nr:hypothetical protein Vretifemale_3976 [Volvox reticuliferus]
MSNVKAHGVFDDGAVEFADYAYGAGGKRCNCKKARCLKLYCVCFSAGLYCGDCACRECLNTPENEEEVLAERSRKLAASPGAFAPKVEVTAEGETVCHKKGCRCRRSFCIKKYCECFDAKVFCSPSCRCEGCLNMPTTGPPSLLRIPFPPAACAADLVPRLVATGGGGSLNTTNTAVSELNENALAVMNDVTAATDDGTDIHAPEPRRAGQQQRAGREGAVATVIPQLAQGPLSFAMAPGAGPFLLSLHPGHPGLAGLSFLETHGPSAGMHSGGGDDAPMEGSGTMEPQLDGVPSVSSEKATMHDGAVLSLQGFTTDPLEAKPLDRRASKAARMFAEADAVLDSEEQAAPVEAPAPSQLHGPSGTTAAGTAAAAGSCGAVGSAAADAATESAGPGIAAVGSAVETAQRPDPPAGSSAADGSGAGDGCPQQDVEADIGERAVHDRRRHRRRTQRRSSSDPEDVDKPPGGGSRKEAYGRAFATDRLQMQAEVTMAIHAGELRPPLAAPPGHSAAAATGGDAMGMEIGCGTDGMGVAKEAAGAAEARPGPPMFILDGGGGIAADALSAMEAVLAAPTLLLEEPQRAGEIAAQLGLDVPQQLAARKAAHIIRTLLCMASSTVRLTRSGALGGGARREDSGAAIIVGPLLSQRGEHRGLHQQPQPIQGTEAVPGVLLNKDAARGGGQAGDETRQDVVRIQPDHISQPRPLNTAPLPSSCGPGGGFTGIMRLGHGSYRFQAAARPGGLDISPMSKPEGNPLPQGTDVAPVKETVAGPEERYDSKEVDRQLSADPEASYTQPGPGGGTQGLEVSDIANTSRHGGQWPLRRGSRIKRPNSLLADMELEHGLDELVDGRLDRRHQSFDAVGHGRRQEHQTQLHIQTQGHRTASPSVEPPSPKRTRLFAPVSGRGGAAAMRSRAQPPGRRGRRGSWRGSEEEEEEDGEEEIADGEPSGRARASLTAAVAQQPYQTSHYQQHHNRLKAVPATGGRSAGQGAGSRPQEFRPAMSLRGRTVLSHRRPSREEDEDEGEGPDGYGDEDEEEVDKETEGNRESQEDEHEVEDEEKGDIEDEGEDREDSGGNVTNEMLAMQALFDLRAANAAPPAPAGPQRQTFPVGPQRQASQAVAQRLMAPMGSQRSGSGAVVPQRLAMPGHAAQQLFNVWQNPLWLGYTLQPTMWW